MRPASRRTWWAPATTAALLVILALPSLASAIGIGLNRAPAPPQAIQRGVGTEQIDFSISYQTRAHSYQVIFQDPAGTAVQTSATAVPGQDSPINATASYTPAPGALEGRYRATVNFLSGAAPGTLESSALVTFDVAAQLGTLQVVKFEDVNGDGVRQAGEPGVPGWVFNLVNPQGNGSVVQTGADGTVTVPNVPAGTWQVAEVVDPMWAPITPTSGTVVVPPNGVGTFTAGNVRPAPISGTVYLDANRNGRLDAGEVGQANVKLILTGTRPGGIAVPTRETRSGAGGAYEFPGNLPGGYTVAIATPGGFTLTSAGAISGIAILSGVGSPNNNFGLTAPGVGPEGGPTPNIGITKTAPETARPGTEFTYTIVVRNRSGFTARNVEVTDLLPVGLTLVERPAGATIRNGVVTWDVGDLAGGASRTLSMRVRVNPNVTGTIRNTAEVTADNLPPRRSTDTTQVVGPPPVTRTGGVTG